MISITTLACPLAPTRTTAGRLSIVGLAAVPGEARHGCMTGSADAFGPDHPQQREPQDPKIKPEGAMVDVPDIQAQAFVPGLSVASVDLGPAGETGPHLVAPRLLGGVEREILDEQ